MRQALPNRRPAETSAFVHDGIRYTATVGHFGNGRPAEVFLGTGKPGTALDAMARDLAVITSIALQHSAPVETLRRAMTRLDDGQAAGPMGRLLDLVAKG